MNLRMKTLLLALLLALAGCAHVDRTDANLKNQKEFGVIIMGPSIGYLVDPRTESCLLVYGGTAATQVDCSKLKKSVPEAAKYITWDPRPWP